MLLRRSPAHSAINHTKHHSPGDEYKLWPRVFKQQNHVRFSNHCPGETIHLPPLVSVYIIQPLAQQHGFLKCKMPFLILTNTATMSQHNYLTPKGRSDTLYTSSPRCGGVFLKEVGPYAKLRSLGTDFPSGVQEQSPGGGLGQSSQKLKHSCN